MSKRATIRIPAPLCETGETVRFWNPRRGGALGTGEVRAVAFTPKYGWSYELWFRCDGRKRIGYRVTVRDDGLATPERAP